MDAQEKVAVLSILVNTGLALFKFALGTVSGSVAIVADGIHSTSDIVASIAVLLGPRLSQRKTQLQTMFDNPFVKEQTGKGIARSEFLVQQGVDVVLMTAPLHGKGPEYVFADANVDIQMTKETQLQHITNTRA